MSWTELHGPAGTGGGEKPRPMVIDPELRKSIFETDERWAAPGLLFASRKPHLHSMLAGCGYETRRSTTYDFSGLSRGSAEFAIFQYTVAGEGSLDYEGRAFKMRAGDAMLLHVPHDHRYYLAPDSGYWRLLFFTIFGMEAVRLMREAETAYGPVIRLEPESPLLLYILSVFSELKRSGMRSQFRASAMAYRFVMTLHECFSYASAGGAQRDPAFLRTVLDFCTRHLADDISVDDIARAAGYSRYHFSRIFHQVYGMPPSKFLAELRLKSAVRILQMECCTIKETAARCGFKDESYFCKVFRKAHGVSPDAFRKVPAEQ